MRKPVAHKTLLESRGGKGVLAAAGVLLWYIMFSLALDSGSYWQYFLSFVFLGVGITFAIRTLKHGKD